MSLDYDYYREPHSVEFVDLLEYHGNLIAYTRTDEGTRLDVLLPADDINDDELALLDGAEGE